MQRSIPLLILLLVVLGVATWLIFFSHGEAAKHRVGIIVLQPFTTQGAEQDLTATLAELLTEQYGASKETVELHISAPQIAAIFIDSVLAPKGLEPAKAWQQRLQHAVQHLLDTLHSAPVTPLPPATYIQHAFQLLHSWLHHAQPYEQLFLVGTLDPCIRPAFIAKAAANVFGSDSAATGSEEHPSVVTMLSGDQPVLSELRSVLQPHMRLVSRDIPTPPQPCPFDTTVTYNVALFLFSPVDSATAACYVQKIFANLPDSAWLYGIRFTILTSSAYQPWRTTWYDSTRTKAKLVEYFTTSVPVRKLQRARFMLERMSDYCTIQTPVDLYFLGTFPDIATRIRRKPLLSSPPNCLQKHPALRAFLDLRDQRYQEAFQNLFTKLKVDFFSLTCSGSVQKIARQ